MVKVFIVGSEGTAGLRLRARLELRADVELLEIDDCFRKDLGEMKKIIKKADFVFLCLPDEAAREVAALAEGMGARIIDTSTAHRTAPGWIYGFPELSDGHRRAISSAARVASPGCHASGFIALIYPLISAGILSTDQLLTCTSLTGYSGGGKKMIADYEANGRGELLRGPKLYAMAQTHKHLPEIVFQCSLNSPPVFLPIVGDFYAGMLVTIPLHSTQLNRKYSLADIYHLYKSHYKDSRLIQVCKQSPNALFAASLAERDDMEIYVSGSEECILLSALFDNLGKGASGAAVECFNLMCGLPEETGLALG